MSEQRRAQRVMRTPAGEIRVGAYGPWWDHESYSCRCAMITLEGVAVGTLEARKSKKGESLRYFIKDGVETAEPWEAESRATLWGEIVDLFTSTERAERLKKLSLTITGQPTPEAIAFQEKIDQQGGLRITLEASGYLLAKETSPEPEPEPEPEPAPPELGLVPSADQLMDAIFDGHIKPTYHEGDRLWELPSGARIWEIKERGRLKGYGADSEETGYLEQMLGGNPFRRRAIRDLLIELEKANALAAKPSPEPAPPEPSPEPSPELGGVISIRPNLNKRGETTIHRGSLGPKIGSTPSVSIRFVRSVIRQGGLRYFERTGEKNVFAALIGQRVPTQKITASSRRISYNPERDHSMTVDGEPIPPRCTITAQGWQYFITEAPTASPSPQGGAL